MKYDKSTTYNVSSPYLHAKKGALRALLFCGASKLCYSIIRSARSPPQPAHCITFRFFPFLWYPRRVAHVTSAWLTAETNQTRLRAWHITIVAGVFFSSNFYWQLLRRRHSCEDSIVVIAVISYGNIIRCAMKNRDLRGSSSHIYLVRAVKNG